jgi:hypothetical protein
MAAWTWPILYQSICDPRPGALGGRSGRTRELLAIDFAHFIAFPNQPKLFKIQPRPAKENQRKKLGFPWILLAEMSLFKGLS